MNVSIMAWILSPKRSASASRRIPMRLRGSQATQKTMEMVNSMIFVRRAFCLSSGRSALTIRWPLIIRFSHICLKLWIFTKKLKIFHIPYFSRIFCHLRNFNLNFPNPIVYRENSNNVTFRVVFKRVLKEVWHKVLKFPIRLGKYERTFEIVEDLQVDQSHANEGNNILHGHRENGVIDSLFRFATLFFWATPIFHAINDVGPRRVEFGVMDSRVEENGGGHQHGNN